MNQGALPKGTFDLLDTGNSNGAVDIKGLVYSVSSKSDDTDVFRAGKELDKAKRSSRSHL